MASGRVFVVGSLNIDIVAGVARHPVPGETVLGTTLSRSPGGKGANQVVAAAAAGARAAMVGCVGHDADGAHYLDRLSRRGVDVTGVRVVDEVPTGTALIVVDDRTAENSIVVIPGANAELTAADVDKALAGVGPGDVVLLQLEVPLDVVAHAVRATVAAGARAVVNTAPYAELPAAILAVCDPVVANEHEAAQIAAAGPLPPSLLVTRGAAGASWSKAGAGPTIEVKAPRVEPVDTTGAGDAFCGALVAALAAGLADGAALAGAVQAGSAAVTRRGAQPAD